MEQPADRAGRHPTGALRAFMDHAPHDRPHIQPLPCCSGFGAVCDRCASRPAAFPRGAWEAQEELSDTRGWQAGMQLTEGRRGERGFRVGLEAGQRGYTIRATSPDGGIREEFEAVSTIFWLSFDPLAVEQAPPHLLQFWVPSSASSCMSNGREYDSTRGMTTKAGTGRRTASLLRSKNVGWPSGMVVGAWEFRRNGRWLRAG